MAVENPLSIQEGKEGKNEAARVAAAIMIQRVWRGKHNKTKEEYMDADWRWDDAARHAKLAVCDFP